MPAAAAGLRFQGFEHVSGGAPKLERGFSRYGFHVGASAHSVSSKYFFPRTHSLFFPASRGVAESGSVDRLVVLVVV